MLLPAVVLLAWLIGYPFISSVLLSFQQARLGRDATWAGLDNFTRMFADSEFYSSMGTTLVFAFSAVTIELVLAWLLALLLWNTLKRWGSLFRMLFTIPMLLSPVVVGVVWRVLLNPQYGWIPALIGDQQLDLLGTPSTALVTMIVIDAWQWTPFLFLIISAGLSGLSDEVLEAAKLDGATGLRLFGQVVFPLTLPVTIVAILFRLLDALKTFDLPFNLTQGGPGNSTQTIAIYLYRQAFTRYDQGYAVAISLIATCLLAAIALSLLGILRRAERKVS